MKHGIFNVMKQGFLILWNGDFKFHESDFQFHESDFEFDETVIFNFMKQWFSILWNSGFSILKNRVFQCYKTGFTNLIKGHKFLEREGFPM